jgi:uncharacterized membrane protein YdcZ (DUF606 family)
VCNVMMQLRRLLKNRMVAAAIDAFFSGSLYALIAWLFLEGTIQSHSLEILTLGLGIFFTSIYARRRLERGRP